MNKLPDIPPQAEGPNLDGLVQSLQQMQSLISGKAAVTASEVKGVLEGVASALPSAPPAQVPETQPPVAPPARGPAVRPVTPEEIRNYAIIEAIKSGTWDDDNLKKITQLSASDAEIVAKKNPIRGIFNLYSLKELTPDAARQLLYAGAHCSLLRLEGLGSLSSETAKVLADYRHNAVTLELPVLETTQETVDILASCKENVRVTVHDKELAKVTALSGGHVRFLTLAINHRFLDLPKVSSITPDAVALLGEAGMNVKFRALTTLSSDSAEALVNADSRFEFERFDAPDDILAILNRRPGCIRTRQTDVSMWTLTDERAKFLGHSVRENLDFENLEELRPAAAGYLSVSEKKRMSFPRIKEISPDAAVCLAKSGTEELFMNGLENPSPEVLGILANMTDGANYTYVPAFHLALGGMKSMSREQAAAIAKNFYGTALSFGVTDLQRDVIPYLSQFKSTVLRFDHLPGLSGEAARAITNNIYVKRVTLDGLKQVRMPERYNTGLKSFIARFFPAFMKKREDQLLTASTAHVRFNGVTELSPEDIDFLVSLPPLRQRYAISRRKMGSYPKEIELHSVGPLSPDAITKLAHAKAELRFSETNDEAIAAERKRLGITFKS